MRDIDQFQLALGLVPPWMVAAADFDAERKRVDIEIDFKTAAGSLSRVRQGRLPGARHRQEDLAAFGFLPAPAFLHARVARIDCPNWGVASSMCRGHGPGASRSCSRPLP